MVCDLHNNAFQRLLKRPFPHISELQCTLHHLLQLTSATLAIHFAHQKGHWVITPCIEDGSVCLYDSAYTSVCKETLETIATVQIMNIHKQTGAVDCSLYAMAVATCLAFKNDPTGVIFDQGKLRAHFFLCMEAGKITYFQ